MIENQQESGANQQSAEQRTSDRFQTPRKNNEHGRTPSLKHLQLKKKELPKVQFTCKMMSCFPRGSKVDIYLTKYAARTDPETSVRFHQVIHALPTSFADVIKYPLADLFYHVSLLIMCSKSRNRTIIGSMSVFQSWCIWNGSLGHLHK